MPGACVGLLVWCGSGGQEQPSGPPQSLDDGGPSVGEDASEAGALDDATSASDATFVVNHDAAGSCSANQPACPCSSGGHTAACWTGPANERNVGACHDGTTTCVAGGEFATWGPCVGEKLVCQQDSGAPPAHDSGPGKDSGPPPPPPQSCLPGSSLSVLIQGPNATAYVPVGSWDQSGTGVLVVPVEGGGFDGTGKTTTIATPNIVSTCGGNSLTGEVVCVSNLTDIYLINGTTLTTTLKSGATASEGFSGGSCETCNVAIDPSNNRAFLSIGYGVGAAFQALDLANNTLGPPIAADPTGTSEALLVDTVRGLVLSPNEQSDYQLLNTTTGQVFDFSFTAQYLEFDAPGEDCTTGIALATDESNGENLLLIDLTQAKFSLSPSGDGGLSMTWSAPNNVQVVPEFGNFSSGTDGIAVAPNSHVGVITGEFGGTGFGAFVLPPVSGSGTPSLVDWVVADIPNTPDGLGWSMGTDPHTVTAYTSPTSGNPYAVFEDDANESTLATSRTFLAVVDLTALLARPRVASPTTPVPHTLATPLGAPDTCIGAPGSLGPNPPGCIVRFIAI